LSAPLYAIAAAPKRPVCPSCAPQKTDGNLRKTPLVTHWEGETMSIDVKRKVPQGDAFYAWFRK
jgi:hypothetical protein